MSEAKHCPYCSGVADSLGGEEGDMMENNQLMHCNACEIDFAIRTGEAVKDWAEEARNQLGYSACDSCSRPTLEEGRITESPKDTVGSKVPMCEDCQERSKKNNGG